MMDEICQNKSGINTVILSSPKNNANIIPPILRIGDQVLTFDVFWPKHLHEVRSTVYIHVQSIKQM